MVMSQFAPSWFQRVASVGVSLRVMKSNAVLVKRGLTTEAASWGLCVGVGWGCEGECGYGCGCGCGVHANEDIYHCSSQYPQQIHSHMQ